MKRKKRRDKLLSSVLTTTMLTVNLSASVFSSAALADSAWNNLGPGFAGETAADAPTGTLPQDSPYKEIMVPLSDEGWLSIGSYLPQDIKGVSFEIGCKIDWDGGGGGGIYIDNWDKVPQFSYTTMKDRITYMFQPDEILRMKQDIKLNLWWTWSDAEGNTHVKDIFFKPGSVRLLVDKDAQPVVRPMASSGSGRSARSSGGGGGKGGYSSLGNGSYGTVTTGNSNRGYTYVVKEKGIIQKIAMKDICPGYQLGDIVKITMKTLGGNEWNSFDLYCAEDGETKIVKKPGGSAHKETTVELVAKPDNGMIFIQINWLGGDYMMYGFDVSVVGHGEPVEDVVIKHFTREDFEEGLGEYFYKIPISIAEEMEKIGAEFGRDEVVITVGLESDGWWNGVLGASGPDGWYQEEYYNGFESSASLTIVPAEDNFSVNIGTLNGTYGEIKNLKLKKTGKQVEPPEILASFTKEEFEAGKGEHFYEVPISIAEKMKEIGAEFGRDEVKITVELESDDWWNGVLGANGPDGWHQEEYYNGFGASASLTVVPTSDSFRVNIGTLNGSYGKVKNLSIVKTGKQVEPPAPALVEFSKEEFEAGKGEHFYEVPISIAEKMEEIGAEFGRDEVKITVELESDDWWNGVLGANGPDGWHQEEYYNGFGASASLTVVPTSDNFRVNIGTLNGSYGKVKSLSVVKTGNQIQPEIIVKELTAADFTDAVKEGENYRFDLSEQLKEAMPKDIELGTDTVEITAEVKFTGCYTWNELQIESASGMIASEQIKPSGNGTYTVTLKGILSDKLSMQWLFLGGKIDGNGSAKIQSLEIKKVSNEDKEELLQISYEDYASAESTSDNNFKKWDISSVMGDAFAQAGVKDGDKVTVTAKFESSGIDWWQFCGSFLKDGQDWGSTAGVDKGRITWTGTYDGGNWAEIQMGEMSEGGYLNLVSLDVRIASQEDTEKLLCITYDDYLNAESTDNHFKKQDISSIMGDAFTQADVKTGSSVTVTAEFESLGIDWWQFCGSFLKAGENDWGSTAGASKNTITWTGTYYGDSWAEIQMGEMSEGGYLNMVSLYVDAASGADVQLLSLEEDEQPMEDNKQFVEENEQADKEYLPSQEQAKTEEEPEKSEVSDRNTTEKESLKEAEENHDHEVPEEKPDTDDSIKKDNSDKQESAEDVSKDLGSDNQEDADEAIEESGSEKESKEDTDTADTDIADKNPDIVEDGASGGNTEILDQNTEDGSSNEKNQGTDNTDTDRIEEAGKEAEKESEESETKKDEQEEVKEKEETKEEEVKKEEAKEEEAKKEEVKKEEAKEEEAKKEEIKKEEAKKEEAKKEEAKKEEAKREEAKKEEEKEEEAKKEEKQKISEETGIQAETSGESFADGSAEKKDEKEEL